MNTATQLLQEALGCVRLVQEDWSQHLQRNNGDTHAEAAIRHVALLREDIEAYLAKQQVEPIPEGYLAALKYQTALFTPEENLIK
jgi:ubiquinone biosynthesis protein UbiJ